MGDSIKIGDFMQGVKDMEVKENEDIMLLVRRQLATSGITSVEANIPWHVQKLGKSVYVKCRADRKKPCPAGATLKLNDGVWKCGDKFSDVHNHSAELCPPGKVLRNQSSHVLLRNNIESQRFKGAVVGAEGGRKGVLQDSVNTIFPSACSNIGEHKVRGMVRNTMFIIIKTNVFIYLFR